jgi:hypothetical protein
VISDDFENYAGQVSDGGYTALYGGTLGAWTVTGGVDLIRNNYGAINDVSIDLPGTPGPDSISQSVNAMAGMTYTLSFDLSMNPPGSQLDVTLGSVTQSYTPNADGSVQHISLSWTAATTGAALLSLGTMSSSNQGPVIDNIMLTAAVPEPETYALMLAGLTAVGFVAGRRRRA